MIEDWGVLEVDSYGWLWGVDIFVKVALLGIEGKLGPLKGWAHES